MATNTHKLSLNSFANTNELHVLDSLIFTAAETEDEPVYFFLLFTHTFYTKA